MTTPLFDSPEEAATNGIPPQSCRVLASRVQGDAAYVLLDTHPEGWRYLYGVNCDRRNGRWCEGTSGNRPGWSRVGPVDDLGTLKIWGESPMGADRVRIRYEGEVREEAVEHGVYLLVWWSVPCPDDRGPRVQAFRVRGEWLPLKGWY